MPKIMAVLTHLDKLHDGKQQRRAKKSFKNRIWAELYQGAKVFYLSGITTTGHYLNRDVLNLARFISVSKSPNIKWRADHPYLLADRVEDITPSTLPDYANRTVVVYGYLRGAPLRPLAGKWHLHLAGVDDLVANNIQHLPDPCPPPPSSKSLKEDASSQSRPQRRLLNQRQRIVYAPMAPQVDGIAYDRDAVYIDINPGDIRFSEKSTLVSNPDDHSNSNPNISDEDAQSSDGEGEKMVKHLQKTTPTPMDQSLRHSELQLVTGGKPLVSHTFSNARVRRRATFDHLKSDKTNQSHPTGDNKSASDSDDDSDQDDDSSDSSDSAGDESDDDSIQEKEPTTKRDNRHATLSAEGPHSGESSDGSSDSDGDDSDDGVGKTSDSIKGDVHSTKMNDAEDGDTSESSDDDENDDDDDDDADDGDGDDKGEKYAADAEIDAAAMRWKRKMLDNASAKLQQSRSPSDALAKYIYGKIAVSQEKALSDDTTDDLGSTKAGDTGANSDEDDFFTPKRPRAVNDITAGQYTFPDIHAEDMTRRLPHTCADWVTDTTLCGRLKRKRFGTGQEHQQNADGKEAFDSDNDLQGDFEDVEAENDTNAEDASTGGDGKRLDEGDGDAELDSDAEMATIRADKIRKKKEFDRQWDQGGGDDKDEGSEEKQEEAGGRGKSRKPRRHDADDEPDFRKAERDRLKKLREETLAGLDVETRTGLEGFLPGHYIRLELQDVPVEFVKHFDGKYPVVLGGLKQGDDEGKTFIRGRIRRHRFKRGVLKSSDPIVMSIGWRRFQSIPVYDVEDQGGRRRFLKYTPEYLHCYATFWAPKVSPGAGIIMCQSLGRDRGGFRIAGSGIVTEVDTSFKVMKKLKLVGEPIKVHKNTAFIKGMFNSEVEVSKYIGARIRTVSGIRGTIKKGISEVSQRGALDRDVAKSPAGSFRAGFEDKILLSDVVFLRAWVGVDVPKFCSIATTLLDKERHGNGSWRMKTIREVRQAREMAIPLIKDSLYKDIERQRPEFRRLKVSKKLEGSLPYASKPKDFAKKSKTGGKEEAERKTALKDERAVVMEKKERNEQRLLQAVYTIRNERSKRRKESNDRRLVRRKKEWDREEEKHAKTSSERKKRKFALEGARDAHEAKRRRGEED